ncbi:Rhodanese-like protein [Ceraceosorus guamensis]|uniref:Rhodanese-like protein n=1 Tax=Ceraceosorus guamensis TaxID=1522189 RepID=A0A316VUS7_9BASI|nr:Rhodanese-like protein [Ceraceosorus guamensis]PWN41210.1 Rhodanese-like protein [Ceraceosorus guamensis]
MLASRAARNCASSTRFGAAQLVAIPRGAAIAKPQGMSTSAITTHTSQSQHLRSCSAAPKGLAYRSSAFHSSGVLSSKGAWAAKGPISYEELKPLTQAPPLDLTIIDVREPDEVQAGIIPSAVSVPLSQFNDAFDSNKGADFRKQYAFDRPAFDDKLVFYCRSGKRSQQALEFAQKNGWNNVRNYTGSWLDWVKQEEGGK